MPHNIPSNLQVFLQELDKHVSNKADFLVGGAGALLLAYDPAVATQDIDFIGEKTEVLRKLSDVAGKDSEIHRLTDYYVDIVPPGWFPNAPGWHERAVPVDVPGLRHINLRVLELHDLILSKLKRFGSGDRQDIRSLCDRDELDIRTLRERYEQARQLYDHDEREKLDRNFRIVEVEFLGLEPSDFD